MSQVKSVEIYEDGCAKERKYTNIALIVELLIAIAGALAVVLLDGALDIAGWYAVIICGIAFIPTMIIKIVIMTQEACIEVENAYHETLDTRLG